MRPTLPLLVQTDFPTIRRRRLDTLQVNLGYRCNQSCLHCHVNAGPTRSEQMDRILGVTLVGAHAGELLAEFVLAMKHGLGLNKILGTLHTYPTMAEANKYAAGEWKKAHAPQRLLQWVARYHAWQRG
jgi:hypothetical protein